MESIQITTIKKELRTDSRLLSSFLDHRHRTILESIDKYLDQLTDLGGIPFETEKGKPLPHGGYGKSTRYAMLNEDQCYFLLTLMRNNPKVVNAKLALVKAFRDARNALAQHQATRLDGKQVRRMETDNIKLMVDYATANGSQNADNYYSIITRLTNKLAGIEKGTRDELSIEQLQRLSMLENMVSLAVRDGINASLHYKEIYKLVKVRTEGLAGFLN